MYNCSQFINEYQSTFTTKPSVRKNSKTSHQGTLLECRDKFWSRVFLQYNSQILQKYHISHTQITVKGPWQWILLSISNGNYLINKV